jgi:RNA polymerase sigma factor (TIGR02999 family)
MKTVSPTNSAAPAEITPLLLAWRAGDQTAFERLYPLVEAELRRLARRCLRKERANHTLQTTALVNEAYLRLIDASQVEWRDRVHFYSVAARLMRRVLVDHARRRGYRRRGGDLTRATFGEALTVAYEQDLDILALNVALDKLAALNSRASEVVELRFFGGLNVEETAEVLGVSARTVKLDWSTAKLWLLRELSGEGAQNE